MNMNKRRRVALLLGEPDKPDQKQIIDGFYTQMMEQNIDICVFAMCQMYQNSKEREIGDSQIFSLIPYETFDAFVVLADTIQTPGVLAQLENEIKTYYSGAVLFVDKKSENFPSIHMDDYGLTKKLVSHLIEVHGYTDIAYLMGKSWNDHAKARLLGYRDCLKEHGIEMKEDHIFEGDFWYTSGESMVDRLLKKQDKLPQAIACGNNCMAIGVAGALEKAGKKVPEDIAVVGFDYSEEGLLSPAPLTAVYMPYEKLGVYAASSILALMEGKDIPTYSLEAELFIGHSCGCEENIDYKAIFKREEWKSVNASDGFDARYNTMLEDLMCQDKLTDFYNVVASYAYQIPNVDGFHLCLNSHWENEEKLVDLDNDWSRFSDEMLWVVKYDANSDENSEAVSTSNQFEISKLFPELDTEREKPKAYFFNPLFFEDKIMGYAIVSYAKKPEKYDTVYPRWLGNLMRGLESMRRMVLAQQGRKLLATSAYTDLRTGLLNYKGLLKETAQKAQNEANVGVYALALDVKGLAKINDTYGRDAGNQLIIKLAGYVRACQSATFCCCLGNDEFLMLSDGENSLTEMKQELMERIEQGNQKSDTYQIMVHMGEAVGVINSDKQMEHLVNEAVMQKNGNKAQTQRQEENQLTFTEEERKVMDVVRDMLNNNLFTYHFQPIISAKTGDIYSYEALMRSNTEIRVSPLDILKYAQALSRLEEVERYTFINIMSYIKNHMDLFVEKKVFINSIPGITLSIEEEKEIEQRMKEANGQVVVELTEQAELDDAALSSLKEKYKELGVEMAVDDYGTGYSNVTNLLRYMPRYVKIDRMLLSHIQDSPQKQHFVNEIIEFAHSNNIMALAEGVETSEELETVIQLGADLIQGYYVARPAAEVLQNIPVKLRRKIQQINLQRQYNKNQSLYVAGREFRISLAKLVADEYECIIIPTENATYRDLSIVGVRGNTSNIVIQVEDGYRGRIQIENVSISAKRGIPCIHIGEDCDVTLNLVGENEFRTGGICVPESSKLTIEGDGNLALNCNFEGYYGIGNDLSHRHGDLIFEQDGSIEVTGNATKGVAIGSGLGGVIRMWSGKFLFDTTGKQGVAIGCVTGNTDIEIKTCDVFLNSAVYSGVGIGAIEGFVKLETAHVAINAKMSGTDLVGIGSLISEGNDLRITNCNVTVSLRGMKVAGVGSFSGKNNIYVEHAGINVHANADVPIMVGDGNKESCLNLNSGEITMNAETEHKLLFGVEDNNTHLRIGGLNFIENGKPLTVS